jgi:hypothetical protein
VRPTISNIEFSSEAPGSDDEKEDSHVGGLPKMLCEALYFLVKEI